MNMNDELIDERAASPVGQPFRVCASKTEAEALELTKTNSNVLYFSSDTNTIIFNGTMRTNPTPDLSSVLKKTDIIDNTSTNDNTKVLSAKQGKLLNDTKLNKTDVIANLSSIDDSKPLAASQGKILNDNKIDKTAIENTVNNTDVDKVLSAAMGKYLNDNKVAKSEIVDNTSTDDATKPLSARQGKFLSDEISNVENSVQDIYAEIPTKTSQLTNDSNYVTTNNVLTKTNTTEYNPVGEYHPATKKYVDGKHTIFTITQEAHQQLISNQFVKAEEAETKINLIFQNIEVFKAIVTHLLKDNILFFKITEKEILKVSIAHVYCNPDNGAYELSFIYIYTSIADADNVSIITKRIFIAINSTKSNFFIVQDLVQSDNINALTKKTKSEYDAINPKNDNTMYAVTE
jgi:hypothetical protein